MKHSIGGLGSIGGHLRNRSESVKSNRSSTDETMEAPGEDTTVVEPDQNNVLSHIISQLRPGADLSRITLPTFILEERSMLERITNFMAHPENVLPIPDIDDPLQRFVAVTKYYLSGWHIKPPGVKKPLNPILGEIFTGYWEYPDGTKGYYISEQTSHHPPKSSYFFMAPEHHIRVDGCLKPRSKFLGNSAASMMEGVSYLRFTNRGSSKGGEKYILTQPNMYARGILFGKMKYELGDHSYIRCPENNLSADIEFKTKGWVGGTYNAIGGIIKNEKTGEQLYELSGLWSGEMFIKDLKTGQKKAIFDASHAKYTPPKARPIEEQSERESQRLWREVCRAVHVADHEKATTEKSKIEDRQREEAKQREEQGERWHPKLFKPVDPSAGEDDLEWVIDTDLDPKADPSALTKQILSIAPILPGQNSAGSEGTKSNVPGTSAEKPAQENQAPPHTGSLIDLDSRPSSAATPAAPGPTHAAGAGADPVANNPLHPTSRPVQPTSKGSLLDEEPLNDKLAGLSMHETMVPSQPKPIKRTDTETAEVDEFVDAHD